MPLCATTICHFEDPNFFSTAHTQYSVDYITIIAHGQYIQVSPVQHQIGQIILSPLIMRPKRTINYISLLVRVADISESGICWYKLIDIFLQNLKEYRFSTKKKRKRKKRKKEKEKKREYKI